MNDNNIPTSEPRARKYYEAYDDRYRQVHEKRLEWFHREPTPIVSQLISELSIDKNAHCLELGCGEGRDAFPLLENGFDILATDISPEAIRFCRELKPELSKSFQVLDCLSQSLDDRFDLILAVALLHMLVCDADRAAFYSFLRRHLKPNGVALICTMGDGELERSSDISTAFELQPRVHPQSGETLMLAGTSCRMVSFKTFENELSAAGLVPIKKGITSSPPDFSSLMYAAVKVAE